MEDYELNLYIKKNKLNTEQVIYLIEKEKVKNDR